MKTILGLSAFYHDSAAALLVDGKIVAAAQEERFTRKKHTPDFPLNAVNYCLEYSGCRIDELDAVVFYDKPFLKFERLLETYYAFAPKGLFQFQLKTRTCLKHFKNELNFCKEFGSEDKLYCGTYCYNSCNTFSRSESGAETRSQTFQFLIDILNQNQDVEQVSTDI